MQLFRRSRPNCSSGRRTRRCSWPGSPFPRSAEPTPIRIDGDGLSGEASPRSATRSSRFAVAVDRPSSVSGGPLGSAAGAPGRRSSSPRSLAEPGWTMFMVSHFHYDPVWWNTQGAYTSEWREDPPGRARQTNGFELVHAHLEMARREPEYKFVLAEVDYLKPYWDTRPEDRADLRRFIAQGRVEVMGGTYNEPNTNLTSPETTIRNLVHGIGFQRDVAGCRPGHRMAARRVRPRPAISRDGRRRRADVEFVGPRTAPPMGPGPGAGGVDRMQFCSEFEWISPSGRGLLTHYMPAHYSAGWWMDSSTSLAEAEHATVCAVRPAQEGRADAQRAAARRHRLHAAEQVGHRHPPRLGRALHLAAIRVRAAAGVFRGGARRTGRARIACRRRRPAT